MKWLDAMKKINRKYLGKNQILSIQRVYHSSNKTFRNMINLKFE